MAPDQTLLQVLARHGVPFVVIGGHAVNFHGLLRATEDTDIVWMRTPAAEQAMLMALLEINAEYIGSEIDPATGIERTYAVTAAFVRSEHLMMLCTSAGFLDLFDSIPGFPSDPVVDLWESAIELDGIRYASLSWLRKLKQASGRPKNLDDLSRLPVE